MEKIQNREFVLLFVDDEQMYFDALQRELESQGKSWRLIYEFRGSVAEARVQKHTPDLVLMDWNFQNSDNACGSSVAQQIAKARGGSLPILLLTKYDTPEQAAEYNREDGMSRQLNIYHMSKSEAYVGDDVAPSGCTALVSRMEQALTSSNGKWVYP